MKTLIATVLSAGLLAAAAGPQSFTGVITDTMCGVNHEHMSIQCKKQYVLSDLELPEDFARKR